MKKFNIHDWQAKQRLNEAIAVTPTFDETHSEFMTRCKELGNSEDACMAMHGDHIFKEPTNEQGFDSRFKDAMGGAGFSDEEQDDIMSRDVGSPFPGTNNVSPFTAKAKDYTEKFKQEYREMSDDGIDEFNKEIIEYLLNAFPSAQATAKVFFAKKGL